jgi:GWxTD domain-containing protein
MRHGLLRLAFVLSVSTALTAGGLEAQEFSFDDLFSNDHFYREHGILKAEGDVGFLADLWILPAASDSARALLGVSLSNSDLQFVRSEDGGWQADYEVQLGFEGDDAPAERSWDQSIQVATFDETMLTGETIVFQTELGLLPGDYEVLVTVRDRNADEDSRGRLTVTVPEPSGPALGEPVLLRQYRPGEGGGEYVVNAAHSFSVAPTAFEVLVQAAGLDPAASYTLTARVLQVSGEDGEPSDSTRGQWSGPVTVAADGSLRHIGAIQNEGAVFGEYRLEATLRNGAGNELGGASTPLLVAGSGGWIAENWEDALSLIKYEATSNEMDILEDVEGEQARIEAWNCFWQIRDPVPATAANEGMSEYFRKVQVANANWQSSLRPGFLSDRGRVYITIGPPDDISQRPVPAGSSAYEVWTYHRYNFQILFVDRIGFNNYQLESVDTYQRELSTVERRKHRFLEERAHVCPLLAPAYE